MDKDRKLKRYRRKDYTEVVDFPVEIVGRDGNVRHYDFEASVRLYQRRMTFAPMRYRDDDLVRAEMGHCRSRIGQLRRSYFHLHGWSSPAGARGPEDEHAALVGELAAFLGRVLRQSGRLDVHFKRLDEAEGADCWYVTAPTLPGGVLLHVFAFDDAEGTAQRACQDLVASLSAGDHVGGDAECLVAWHHAGDGAFVLSGRAADVGALSGWLPAEATGADMEPVPWDEVEEFVRRGDLPAAFLRCRSILEAQPWHRDAYAMGALLAVHLRRAGDGEDLAFVGAHYFPDDGMLELAAGLALLHQDRAAEAELALERALSLDDSLTHARTLRLLAQLDRRAYVHAWRSMRLPSGLAEDGDATAHREVAGVASRLALLVGSAVSASTLSLVASVTWMGPQGVFPLLAVVTAGVGGSVALRRRYERLRTRHLFEDPGRALQRVRHSRPHPRR